MKQLNQQEHFKNKSMDVAIKRLNETVAKRDKMVGDLLYTYRGLTDSQSYKKEEWLRKLPYKNLVNLCKNRIPSSNN